MKVIVTQKHIDAAIKTHTNPGKKLISGYCPIAHAVRDIIHRPAYVSDVQVDYQTSSGFLKTLNLPKKATKFIERFDKFLMRYDHLGEFSRNYPKPITFTLP